MGCNMYFGPNVLFGKISDPFVYGEWEQKKNYVNEDSDFTVFFVG